jgi:hypothetical protein
VQRDAVSEAEEAIMVVERSTVPRQLELAKGTREEPEPLGVGASK